MAESTGFTRRHFLTVATVVTGGAGAIATAIPFVASFKPSARAQAFFCPCHGSKFDLAGRVFSGVPAPTNLIVPPHRYLNDTTILIGSDTGNS